MKVSREYEQAYNGYQTVAVGDDSVWRNTMIVSDSVWCSITHYHYRCLYHGAPLLVSVEIRSSSKRDSSYRFLTVKLNQLPEFHSVFYVTLHITHVSQYLQTFRRIFLLT